ncbi:MAG TPA: hypothetical protein VMZ53_15060, partial [Kofleriaceae bacterium]|nr:hypothetical protein [Kofleriaceae bacterium]
EQQAGWKHNWGPPHDRAWVEKSLAGCGHHTILLRVAGSNSDLLFGLEAGMHRFIGLAGEPCHVTVELVEPQAEFTDAEWGVLGIPGAPPTARGKPMREVTIPNDRVVIVGDECEAPWSELGQRLPEAAAVRYISALQHTGHHCAYDESEKLWVYENPTAALKAAEKKKKEEP